jgi:hypothetical protein
MLQELLDEGNLVGGKRCQVDALQPEPPCGRLVGRICLLARRSASVANLEEVLREEPSAINRSGKVPIRVAHGPRGYSIIEVGGSGAFPEMSTLCECDTLAEVEGLFAVLEQTKYLDQDAWYAEAALVPTHAL